VTGAGSTDSTGGVDGRTVWGCLRGCVGAAFGGAAGGDMGAVVAGGMGMLCSLRAVTNLVSAFSCATIGFS
jgi:hypothetical protein